MKANLKDYGPIKLGPVKTQLNFDYFTIEYYVWFEDEPILIGRENLWL